MSKETEKRYGPKLIGGLVAVCLVAVVSFGITIGFAQQAVSPVEQLTGLAKVSGDNFGEALDYLQSLGEPLLGFVGDEATNITDVRPGRLVTYDNVFVTTDLEVGGTIYAEATTSVQQISLGSPFSVALDFSEGATTTIGGLFAIENTGADNLCTITQIDITTGSTVGGALGTGHPFDFSVATSTSGTALSGNVGIIATTTVPTSTTKAIIDNVRNPGTYVAADQDIGGTTFEWNNGIFLVGQFDSLSTYPATSSAVYTGMAGKFYATCHTR